jgi:hypothetical protein
MPVTQRLVALFLVAIVLHEWEETRFPGGFVQLMTGKLGIGPPGTRTSRFESASIDVVIRSFGFIAGWPVSRP